jgi:hypothetical protein
MSERSMEMAMELFRASPNFRKAVRNAENKGAYVDTVLPSHTPPTNEEKLAGAEEEGLTDAEKTTINSMPWDTETDDQLLARIGQVGCTYT